MKSYSKKTEEVLKDFDTNKEKGLSLKQVDQARQKYGENKLLAEKGESVLHMIVGELTGFLNILLILVTVKR